MKIFGFVLSLSLAAALPASAQVISVDGDKPFLHPLFSDNAVLQRDRRVPVWGWSTPGTNIVLKMDAATQTVRCGSDGKWSALIGPFRAGGPHQMTVAGARAGEVARRSNILFGDVWLCSGQSNMELGVGYSANGEQEVAAANFPNIRLFSVPKATSPTPRTSTSSQWLVCNPANIAAGDNGGFSAVGYFFGRELNRRLNVPIGLIHSSWGGTFAEAWTSAQGLERDTPEFKLAVDALSGPNAEAPYEQRMRDWWRKNDAGTVAGYEQPTFDDAAWKSVQVPGAWEKWGDASLAQFDGAAWFRRVVDVPANMAGKDLTLSLGQIDDAEATFWNGTEVGSAVDWTTQRDYKISGMQVLAGRNVIAVRVLDSGGWGGFVGEAERMKLHAGTTSIPLTGAWQMQRGKALADFSERPQNPGGNPNIPTVLYNAMISPLVPYGLKGAIWYQGESNASRAEQYKKLLPSLVRDWRGRFGSGDFPFHIVQLAGFMNPDDTPKNDDWPRLREAQNIAAHTVGRSGVALAIDLGESWNIHPKNKQDVGLRLALQALARDYGQKIVCGGPALQSSERRGETMVLKFANTGGALSLKGEAGRVFALAGADKKFSWATPNIQGDTVTLTAPDVKEPQAVRFGWSNLPRAFLYNQAGLPASPFRTDKW